MVKVYVQKGTDALQTTLENLKKANPKLNGKILIKPNLTTSFAYEENITTSPKVVEGVVEYLRSRGIRDIVIGEGAGGSNNMSQYFETTGFRKLSERLDVPLVDLNQDKQVRLPIKKGHLLKEIIVAKTALERKVISVPKMKTHLLAEVTLCVKNMMGVILPYNKKLILHLYFNDIKKRPSVEEFRKGQEDLFKRLVDFYSALKPVFNVVDAFEARDGNGIDTNTGRTIKLGCILSGKNSVAVDYVGAYLMGFNLSDLYLKYLRGNRIRSLKDIEILSNVELAGVKKRFKPLLLKDMK